MNAGGSFQILWAVVAGFWIVLDVITLGTFVNKVRPKNPKYFILKIQFNSVEIISRDKQKIIAKKNVFTETKDLQVMLDPKRQTRLPLHKTEKHPTNNRETIEYFMKKIPAKNGEQAKEMVIIVPIRLYTKNENQNAPIFIKKYLRLKLQKIGKVKINIGEIISRIYNTLEYNLTSGTSNQDCIPFNIQGKINYFLRSYVQNLVFNFFIYVEAVNQESFANLSSQVRVEQQDQEMPDQLGWPDLDSYN